MPAPTPRASVLDTAYKAVRDLKVDEEVGDVFLEEYVAGKKAAGGLAGFDEAKRKEAADKAYARAAELLMKFSGITTTYDESNPFARGAARLEEDQRIKNRLGFTLDQIRHTFIRPKAGEGIAALAGRARGNVEQAQSGFYIAGLTEEDKDELAAELIAKAKGYGASELDPRLVRATLPQMFYDLIEGPRKAARGAASRAMRTGTIDDMLGEE